jgi:hypothetical protein
VRTISLEEHFVSPAFLEGPGKGIRERAKNPENPMAMILEQLTDLGSHRIAAMDAAGIDAEVLSLNSPGEEQLEPAEAVAVGRETNDFLAEAVKRHPNRFAGFAALPTAALDKAAGELNRKLSFS